MKTKSLRLILLAALAAASAPASASAQEGCYSRLQGDTLTIGNALIERRFLWRNDTLRTLTLTDKAAGRTWRNHAQAPDFSLAGIAPGGSGSPEDAVPGGAAAPGGTPGGNGTPGRSRKQDGKTAPQGSASPDEAAAAAGSTARNGNTATDSTTADSAAMPKGGRYAVRRVAETAIRPASLETVVEFPLGGLEVRRVYRIYADAPAIACDTYIRGRIGTLAEEEATRAADRRNIESTEHARVSGGGNVLDRFAPGGVHWQSRIVEFRDVTDWNNNLVFTTDLVPYRKNRYRGNLLFARDGATDGGFFLLKEAPSSDVQPAYPGYDFTAEFGSFAVAGLGLTARDLGDGGEWVRAYGCVLGVASGGEYEQLTALRRYQKCLRRLLPGRDEMVMMNTWGDRSQDTKIDERFCMEELRRAARLGITHFQIDDGWQTGKSPNSAVAKGSFRNIWDNPGYWKPDPAKYPRGLRPVVELGRELGIEVCLWFNPSVQNDYADWEKDAQAMIDLYEACGIRTFKIDGLAIPNKRAEANLRRLFDRVLERTDHCAVFNLDATAGRRGGYHLFQEYGNVFLENRYTDWGNYYPYQTLRNLWMLARYVPAERLQIEFLNKWRNAEKYAGDRFAPAACRFEYLFALTLAGQPLAWMEAGNLPDEAFALGGTVRRYREIQHDFHRGVILPIGDEPSGRSWTGFQSVDGERGYLVFYREQHPDRKALVETWLPEGAKVRLIPVLGSAKGAVRRVGRRGALEVEIPAEEDYALYRYEIIRRSGRR